MMATADIVVVGSGLAGWTVVRELRKLDRAVPLTLITGDAGDFYSKPMLSNALAQGKSAAALITTAAATMAEQQQVRLMTGCRVTAIDRQRRQLETSAGAVAFGRLVLALGADPIRLPLAGDAAGEVLSVNDIADYARFRERLSGARSVAILGGGLIGCEFANDLVGAGHAVSVIDPAPTPIAGLLPAAAGRQLLAPLAALGVDWKFGLSTSAVERHGAAYRLTLNDGSTLTTDLVLSAVGLRPRIELARQAGLDVDRGIRVDAELRTSDADVFALGDCAQYPAGPLPYVMPIMHAGRALAATLAGRPTPVRFPGMPVIIKTPAHPIVVAPAPRGIDGAWQVNGEISASGIGMEFVDAAGRLRGFVLTGQRTAERNAWTARLTTDAENASA